MKKYIIFSLYFLTFLGLINFSFAQTSSKKPPFTLVEAKLPQKAQYVITLSPYILYSCNYQISKNLGFTLTDFREENGGIYLSLNVRNNTKNKITLVRDYEILGETEKKPFNVYLISNEGNFYLASNVENSITLNPGEIKKINLEFDNAQTENYFFLIFNIDPRNVTKVGCDFVTLAGPFYLPGAKYLVPNKKISYKVNQSFSPEELSEFLRFNVNKITASKKGGFSMNLSVNLIRERKAGEGYYEFYFNAFRLPQKSSEIDKNYFEGYLLDNNGNFYLVVPKNFSNKIFYVDVKSKKVNFVEFTIIPNFINGAEEFSLYLNSTSEAKDQNYYLDEIKKSLYPSFYPLVEIEEIKVPEKITSYYIQE